MFTTRTHALISGGLFLTILVLGWGGTALQGAGVIKQPGALRIPMMILFFSLFIAFAFSLIPTMVKLFVAGQGSIGNADKGLIKFVARHEAGVIWAFWTLWIVGLAIAIPAAIKGGFFSDSGSSDAPAPAASNDESAIARQIARMPLQGTLVAAPGMPVEQMIRGSSLKIDQGANPAVPNQPQYAGGAIFNFRVAGTAIEFPRCRYYFVTTYTKDRSRIESINVGTAQATMTRAQLDSANAALRSKLTDDGWLSGHEVYRTPEDQTLHSGLTRGDEGWMWLKGDTILHIEKRRMDDPVAGEAPATAGEWIQFVELWQKSDYPNIDRYEFAPLRN